MQDLDKSSVISIVREADNDALKRHCGQPGSDGTGNLGILCACHLGFTLPEWPLHLHAVVEKDRETRHR
jgi:hypothetical protein